MDLMVNKNKIDPKSGNWPVWRLTLTILNTLAIVINIILSWHYFKGGAMPGCGSGSSCDLAKMGLAVWRATPETFPEFDNWMFTFDSGNSWLPRSFEAAKAKAIELVGQEKLSRAMADPWIYQYIQNGVRKFGQTLQNNRGAIPKMIYNGTWVIPEPYNTKDLVTILQESLGVPKP